MSTNGAEGTPRLCHVIKVDNFDGYGFNLHAEQGKPGQYIGKVDDGSPAETAGLKQGDRILEVNGISIANDVHKQVVQKIKSLSNETKLLVVTLPPNEKVPGLEKQAEIENAKNNEKKEEKPTAENGDDQMMKHEIFTPKGPQINKLNLGMTAAEMRAQLAARKKTDPKLAQMDLKHKFEIMKKL